MVINIKMWENVVWIHVIGKSEHGKSDVLLEMLNKERYECLVIPKFELDFDITLERKNDEWVIEVVKFAWPRLDEECGSDLVKFGGELEGMYVSDKIIKKIVMNGKFPVRLLGKGCPNKIAITWEYLKNMKKKMKEKEKRLVDLVSEMVCFF